MSGFRSINLVDAKYPDGDFAVSTNDGRNFTLLAPVVYTAKSGENIIIPTGAKSDGASTPAFLWPTIPPFGTYWRAAFLHDYLYRCTQRPKVECDELLKEAMQSLGVDCVLVDTIFEGVNIGGEEAFAGDRKAQAS